VCHHSSAGELFDVAIDELECVKVAEEALDVKIEHSVVAAV
jgi:hypothetical protein